MYSTVIPDLQYYLDLIACRSACPVNTHAGRYVQAIAGGDFSEAYEVAAAPNPLASICGRICAHPCESACRRASIDNAISIRALKRAACERYGPEAGRSLSPLKRPKSNGIRVAVVGAGAAGLSCAYYLALNGFEVTIFEATPVVGGMLYLGIPEYRLPRYLIRMEVERILRLGVDIKTGTMLGRDFSLQTLKEQGYRAIFLAIGATKSKNINLPGIDLDGTVNGIDFLINVNLGYKVNLTEKVIVIGGGNVAIDIARTAIREVETPEIDDGSATIDAARLALRLGATEVHVVSLESWEEMPAHRYEVEEARAEGIFFHTSRGPKEILGKDGKVVGLKTAEVLSLFDSQGRFNPTLQENTDEVIEAGTVILAIGQQVDREALALDPELELSQSGNLRVDPETLQTNLEGVFAGGDAVFGPRIVIDSVANGKRAARSIMGFLKPATVPSARCHFVTLPSETYSMPHGYETAPQVDIPQVSVDRRVGFSEVELGYSEEEAGREASRCLKCNINTIFDSGKCILCGGCVDVCPMDCLLLVDARKVQLEGKHSGLVTALPEKAFAIIKDETLCIRCGLCAKRCPTQAITMERMVISERANA